MQKISSKKVDNIKLRFALTKDIYDIISINLKTLPEHYSHSFFIEILIDSPETFIVAEDENKIIGYIMCRVEYGFSILRKFNLARKGHIVSFAVLDEYRNRGIGKRLVNQAINGMHTRKCVEAYLEVRINNGSAIKLYEDLEFKKISRLNSYYKDKSDAFLMCKKINIKN